jgi:hypothetical protein
VAAGMPTSEVYRWLKRETGKTIHFSELGAKEARRVENLIWTKRKSVLADKHAQNRSV